MYGCTPPATSGKVWSFIGEDAFFELEETLGWDLENATQYEWSLQTREVCGMHELGHQIGKLCQTSHCGDMGNCIMYASIILDTDGKSLFQGAWLSQFCATHLKELKQLPAK